ncbi:MAG: hypothetical protein ACLPWO_06405, partial [Thermoplasmata archaeon]
FNEVARKHGVKLPRLFGSSRFVVDELFSRRYGEGRAFLYAVLSRVEPLIRHVDVTWLIASPVTTPTVTIGGKGSAQRDIPIKEFMTSVGNVYPMIAAWVYGKVRPLEKPALEIDHFQGKPSVAWEELSSSGRPMTIVPKGDECSPFICVADIIAYLTDKGLHAMYKWTGKGKLFPDQVKELWKGKPFSVRAGYLDQDVFPDIAPISASPIYLHRWYPSPTTYLLVDQGLLTDLHPAVAPAVSGNVEEREVTYRNFVETSGYGNAAYLSAQIDRGGFKFFDAQTDAPAIRDGDRLVYMGKTSKERAETIRSAVDVKVESMLELRERLRTRGYDC